MRTDEERQRAREERERRRGNVMPPAPETGSWPRPDSEPPPAAELEPEREPELARPPAQDALPLSAESEPASETLSPAEPTPELEEVEPEHVSLEHVEQGSVEPVGLEHVEQGSVEPVGLEHVEQGSVEPAGLEHVEQGSVEPVGLEHVEQGSVEPAGLEHVEQGSVEPAGLEHIGPGAVELEDVETGPVELVEPGRLPMPAHRPRLRRPHLHRPHVHRPHLHRPHLHRSHRPQRPHVARARSLPARLGALAALALVAALVGVGAFALERAIRHKPVKSLATRRVVIPEGSTSAQIARIAHTDGLSGDYLKAVHASTQLQPSRYGAPASERSLEGFLFPATYEMYAGAPASDLLAKQLSAFHEGFSSVDRARAKALGVTPYQLLTVASMVEREASMPRERPLVAAVIYNRLRRDMPLGIDATLRYALHNDYTHALTQAQLHSDSPYNTRTHTGLPPTPISNPGLASIEASANPAHVSYLYYVARADGCPGQVFSSSYAQFERDAAAYQDALRANHGNVPSCKRR